MKGYWERKMTVAPSMCDFEGRLGVPDTFALFMDIATEHAESLGIGMNGLMRRDLFWLTVRTKIRFLRRPGMTETVVVRTWPETPERSRCNRDYRILQNGATLVEGKTEWMIMNLKTGRLFPTDGVFPPELEIEPDRALPGPFTRFADDFGDIEPFGSFRVRSTDIDLGGHMNNAAYVRAIAGLFGTKEWSALNVREMEVAFRAPCFEGNVLDAQRRDIDGSVDLRLSCAGKTIVLARIERGE